MWFISKVYNNANISRIDEGSPEINKETISNEHQLLEKKFSYSVVLN